MEFKKMVKLNQENKLRCQAKSGNKKCMSGKRGKKGGNTGFNAGFELYTNYTGKRLE